MPPSGTAPPARPAPPTSPYFAGIAGWGNRSLMRGGGLAARMADPGDSGRRGSARPSSSWRAAAAAFRARMGATGPRAGRASSVRPSATVGRLQRKQGERRPRPPMRADVQPAAPAPRLRLCALHLPPPTLCHRPGLRRIGSRVGVARLGQVAREAGHVAGDLARERTRARESRGASGSAAPRGTRGGAALEWCPAGPAFPSARRHVSHAHMHARTRSQCCTRQRTSVASSAPASCSASRRRETLGMDSTSATVGRPRGFTTSRRRIISSSSAEYREGMRG